MSLEARPEPGAPVDVPARTRPEPCGSLRTAGRPTDALPAIAGAMALAPRGAV